MSSAHNAYAEVVRQILPSEAAKSALVRKAATFYASFDEAVRGDFGGGLLEPSTRFNHETAIGQFLFEKGINTKVFQGRCLLCGQLHGPSR